MVQDDAEDNLAITGESQVTISRKWVAIVTAVVVTFVVAIGWMYQVVATARPVSAEYAKEHNLKVSGQPQRDMK